MQRSALERAGLTQLDVVGRPLWTTMWWEANLRTKDLTVLVVTSSALSQARDELTALGFEGYFQKPSEYAEFLKLGPLVKALLERGSGS